MRIIFHTGKGGVGKSVISSATALKSASYGYKTLLISTDPAHTLTDVFGFKIGPEDTKVTDNLYAIQVDPIYEAKKHYSTIIEFVAEVLKAKHVDELIAFEVANFPGITGAASLLKLLDYIEEGRYDVFVLDMVPSGDALRILYLPYILCRFSRRFMKIVSPFMDLGKYIGSLINVPVPPSEVIDVQVKLLDMLERIHRYVVDGNVSSLRIIVNPDAFSIENAKRTFMQASIYGLNTDLLILNKLLPSNLSDEYLSRWIELQNEYILKCELEFSPLPIKKARLLREEVRGIDRLRLLAEELFSDEDPTKIFYRGRPIEVKHSDNTIEVVISAPYVSKDEVEVERIGDELLVHLFTAIGRTTVILPLPAITLKYTLSKARIINGRLHIYFTGEEFE